MSSARLQRLPIELHRMVHDFLTFPSYEDAEYCAVRDGGAAFRCVCRDTRASVPAPSVAPRCRGLHCCSVASAVHEPLGLCCLPPPSSSDDRQAVRVVYDCEGASVIAYKDDFSPEHMCVLHDCCGESLSDGEKATQVEALQCVVSQLAQRRKAISCCFPSWVDLSYFSETMHRAGVHMYGYKAVVTRRKEGIRVNWLRSYEY